MGRVLLLLCLALAIFDPLLRHWEAAKDFSVSLAELNGGVDRSEMEPVDDEAIDEPGVAIVKAGTELPLAVVWGLADQVPLMGCFQMAGISQPCVMRRGEAFHVRASSMIRLSQLQRFLC